jgi:hypothetical protein
MQLSFDRLLTGSKRRITTFIPPNQLADPRDYTTRVITAAEARAFVEEHHYSGSMPPAIHAYGLVRAGALVGVAVLSWPTNNATTQKWLGMPAGEALELGRFILLDEEGFNSETIFLAKMRRDLANRAPGLKALLAFSDPAPRSIGGQIAFRGHFGTIYQALDNSVYLGRSSSRRLTILPDGRTLSARAIEKLKLDAESYAEKQLVSAGAPKRNPSMTGAERISDLIDRRFLTIARHAGCHAFVLPLGCSKDRQRCQIRYDRGLERPRLTDAPICVDAYQRAA